MKIITAEKFKQATGRLPEDDDLERSNCPEAGTLMHSCCGWNEEQNLPQFMVGPVDIYITDAECQEYSNIEREMFNLTVEGYNQKVIDSIFGGG